MSIEKRLNVSAWKKATAWGTEVDVNVALSGIYPLNPGAPKFVIPGLLDEGAASAFESDMDQGDYSPVDFGLDFDLRYEGLGPIIAQIMGTAGVPAQQDTTDAYLHTLQLKNTISGLFGTYVTQKHDKIHVVPSAKPYKATITLSGGLVKVSVAMRGDKIIDDSAIVTGVDSVTFADKHNRALARQGIYRMNAQDGAALADGDKVKIKNAIIEIERTSLSSDYESESRSIIEPLEGDKPQIKVTLEFNRMDDVNKLYFANFKAETEKKMDIVFTGALIEDTYYYYHKFQFPRLKIEDIEYADANLIPAKIVLRGLEADAAPTGMDGVTKPVQWDVMNKRTTDMLA